MYSFSTCMSRDGSKFELVTGVRSTVPLIYVDLVPSLEHAVPLVCQDRIGVSL